MTENSQPSSTFWCCGPRGCSGKQTAFPRSSPPVIRMKSSKSVPRFLLLFVVFAALTFLFKSLHSHLNSKYRQHLRAKWSDVNFHFQTRGAESCCSWSWCHRSSPMKSCLPHCRCPHQGLVLWSRTYSPEEMHEPLPPPAKTSSFLTINQQFCVNFLHAVVFTSAENLGEILFWF